jgi:hypothetical protein
MHGRLRDSKTVLDWISTNRIEHAFAAALRSSGMLVRGPAVSRTPAGGLVLIFLPRRILLPRSFDAGQNPGAQKHYCPHHNPMQRQMYYNGAVRETANHDQESNDVDCERHLALLLHAVPRRPVTKLITKTTSAITSSKWIKAPPMCRLKPSSHRIKKIATIVQSIVYPFRSFRAFQILE